MFSTIIDPNTHTSYQLNSNNGQQLLNQYLNQLGGHRPTLAEKYAINPDQAEEPGYPRPQFEQRYTYKTKKKSPLQRLALTIFNLENGPELLAFGPYPNNSNLDNDFKIVGRVLNIDPTRDYTIPQTIQIKLMDNQDSLELLAEGQDYPGQVVTYYKYDAFYRSNLYQSR